MPTANELLVSACADGLSCLNRHGLLAVAAQAYSSGEMANIALVNACANGFSCLDKKELLVVIAQALND